MYSVSDLHSYYQSPKGQKIAALLSQDIAGLWPERTQTTEVAVGFPFPFLPHRCMPPVLMPGQLGIAAWHGAKGVQTAEIEAGSWPISTDILDRVFLAHALEFAPNPAELLAEAARCLCGGGKLVMMVPHRNGLWVRSSRTPFGHGIPFSRGQLHRLLTDSGLQPTAYHRSLLPSTAPSGWPQPVQKAMERLGGGVARVFGGVLLVEATKMVYVKKGARTSNRARKVIQLQGKTVLPRRHH